VAKDHQKGLDTAIFYIDVRTTGKDFERYFNRAKDEARGPFHQIKDHERRREQETGNPVVRYTDEAGKRCEEEFDIVVLSIGLCQSRESIELAGNWVSTSMPEFSRDQQFLAPSDLENLVSSSPAASIRQRYSLIGDGCEAVRRQTQGHCSRMPVLASPRKRSFLPSWMSSATARVGVFICRCGSHRGCRRCDRRRRVRQDAPLCGARRREPLQLFQDTQENISKAIKEHKPQSRGRCVLLPSDSRGSLQETVEKCRGSTSISSRWPISGTSARGSTPKPLGMRRKRRRTRQDGH